MVQPDQDGSGGEVVPQNLEQPENGGGQDAQTVVIRNKEGEVLHTHSGSSLRGAFLAKAYLRGAQLHGVDLRGANLSDADLREADLTDADLRDVQLVDARLEEADLSRADLRRAALGNANLTKATLIRANLQALRWEWHKPHPTFQSAKMMGANLAGATINDVSFQWADLRRASFVGAVLCNPDFSHADLRETDFRDAVLASVRLDGALLYRTDFSVAQRVWRIRVEKESAYFDSTTKWPNNSPLMALRAICWTYIMTEAIVLCVGLAFLAAILGCVVYLVAVLLGYATYSYGWEWYIVWTIPAFLSGFAVIVVREVYSRLFSVAKFEHDSTGGRWCKALGSVALDSEPLCGPDLHLQHAAITEDLLKRLAAMPHLDTLNLAWTNVVDSDIPILSKITDLLWLDLTGTHVTDEGVAKLQEALPHCEIKR